MEIKKDQKEKTKDKEEILDDKTEKELPRLQEEAEDFEKKAEEYLNSWKRCQADFENYKKRQTEERKNLLQYGNISLILEILPVVDNFHTSTEHIPEDQKKSPWVTGIMHIQSQLEKVLEDNNVLEIPVKVGDKFDPAIHEALENKKDQKEECKNIVKQVVMRGYKIGDKVIRPARVIVE